MAKLLKLRRGTTSQHNTFTGAEGEVTIDTTKDTAVVHDGSQAGGRPLAREDMSNVSSSSIAGRLGADSIATTKIAGGALPTDVTVATANIVATGVSAGTVGSSTAIPIITVNNKGQVTNTSTTPVDATKIENGSAKVQVASMAKDTVGNTLNAVNPLKKRAGGTGGGGVSGGMSQTVSADVDLFDIVKGQLLDEGLSEEEIKDIMLTLTPDEIMSEMAVNPRIAAMDAKNKADMIARSKAKEVPQNIRDASKRQMKAGTPREDPKNPYTTQDKKDIINYNKNK